jgi:T5SS/PEP-CTERM-associated repeat protein
MMSRFSATGLWCCGLLLAALGMGPLGSVRADTAYVEDFSSGTPSTNWSGDAVQANQAVGGTNTSWYLGLLNNDAITLSLTGLNLAGGTATANSQGEHTFITVSFDLYIIGDWVGNNPTGPTTYDPSTFMLSYGNTPTPANLLTTTFSNDPYQYQTYPYDSSVVNGYWAQPGAKGANQINTLGFTGSLPYSDAVYSMSGGRNQSFTFNQSADDLTLIFSAANLDSNSFWGITNVKVVTGGVFTWQSALGDGWNGGWDYNPHWLNPNGVSTNLPGANDAVEFSAPQNYFVSIHQDYDVGFLRVKDSLSSTSGVLFNTIGHTLTLTAGDYNNASLAVADGSNLIGSLLVFNSNDDSDSNINGVINAQTLAIARGTNAQGTLTLDGALDPYPPGSAFPQGNVILNVQREITIGDGGAGSVPTLNILHGAILNGGLGGGSASSNPADGNTIGVYAYVDGTVNVDDHAAWNQTGAIWVGVLGAGSLNVTNASHVNIYQLPYDRQQLTIGGTLAVGGFTGSSGAVLVKDPGSQLNVGQVLVGNTAVESSLTIDNLGVLNASSLSIGWVIGDSAAGTAHVDVTHQGQLFVTTPDGLGQLNVGDSLDGQLNLGYARGDNGNLFNVGTATADSVIIGNSAGVSGELDVLFAQAADAHSLLTVNKTLIVGASGHGVLFMSAGGVTTVLGQGSAGGTIVTVGDQPGAWGQIYPGGGAGGDGWAQGSTFDASAGGVVLGNFGYGRWDLAIGGQGFARTLVMAQGAGSSADIVIDGNGSDNIHTTLLQVSDPSTGLTVGNAGTTASINILNGGLLDTFHASVGGQSGAMASGSVTIQDLRDPATVTNHQIGSAWFVHGQTVGLSSTGGTLDIGGEGLGGTHGGSGTVTVGAGGQLRVDIAIQLGQNGKLIADGGAITVGTADPLDNTPGQLHILASSLPNATAKVFGMGLIQADVLLDFGGNIGPNASVAGQAGTLSIVGSFHEMAGGNFSVKLQGAAAGQYDTLALVDSLLAAPSGAATFDSGAIITLIGENYGTAQVQVGDYFDILTAASVTLAGPLDLHFSSTLPSTNWYYDVVSVPGGQALRIEYGTPVPEPGALCLLGAALFALLIPRRRAV